MLGYTILYRDAASCIAIMASCATIIGGLYAFIALVSGARTAALETGRKEATKRGGPQRDLTPGDILPYVFGGAALFVVACLTALIELKIGAWAAAIGCN